MAFKAILLCAAALLVQTISGSCTRRISIPSCGFGSSISSGYSGVSNNGGALIITSVGPIVPSGIAVATDLGLAGDLVVDGTLPFLSAVEFGCTLPTSGSASVSYGCGDGNIGIDSVIGGNSGSIGRSSGSLSLNSGSIGGLSSNSCGCSY